MKVDKITRDYFIYMISCYINGITIELDDKVNKSEIIRLFEIHQITGILASLNKNNVLQLNNEQFKKVSNYIGFSVLNSVKYENLYNYVSKTLEAKEITNIGVKGISIKKFYPEPDLRTMTDIDIVINKSQIKKAKNILLEKGFVECVSGVDEIKLEKSGLYVELHEDLTSDDFKNGIDYKLEMQYIFENTVDKSLYIKELKPECHLVYLILHIAHHLFYSGCGIRQILDIALLIKSNNIHINSIQGKLDDLKLSTLGDYIFFMCYKWFEIGDEINVYDLELFETLSEYIINGGVFGFDENRESNTLIREQYQSNIIVANLKNFFPSSDIMKSKILWYRSKPVIFLPFAWIYYWGSLIKHKPKKIIDYFKYSVVKSEDASKEYLMLKKLGFYDTLHK